MSDNLPNILLVEDDAISKDITTLFLKGLCNIEYADTGQLAIQMLKEKRYDGFLMDINLGRGLGGIEVVQAIKEIDHYSEVPIVAITAFAMAGDKEEFLAHGCTHYLSKPYTKNALITLMKEALKLS